MGICGWRKKKDFFIGGGGGLRWKRDLINYECALIEISPDEIEEREGRKKVLISCKLDYLPSLSLSLFWIPSSLSSLH